MSDAPKQSDKDGEKTRREARLATALRENLRRRKAQARGRERPPSDDRKEPEPEQER